MSGVPSGLFGPLSMVRGPTNCACTRTNSTSGRALDRHLDRYVERAGPEHVLEVALVAPRVQVDVEVVLQLQAGAPQAGSQLVDLRTDQLPQVEHPAPDLDRLDLGGPETLLVH